MIFTPYPIGKYKIDDAVTVRYNVRSMASASGNLLTQVRGGDVIEVVVADYSRDGNYVWQQIKKGNIIGYVAISLMRLVKYDVEVKSVIMTGSPTNIRSMPSVNSNVYKVISKNGMFLDIDPQAVLYSDGEMWITVTDDTQVSWVQEKYVKYMQITSKQLEVSHYTQIGNIVHNDCGQASVRMLANYYYRGKKELASIDHLALATNTANKLTSSEDLIKIGKYCGIELIRLSNYSFIDMAHVISADSPLIVLVRYGEFKPAPYHYAGGHWMVVTGFDEQGFICNDPLQIEGSWHVPTEQFDRALQGIALRLVRS